MNDFDVVSDLELLKEIERLFPISNFKKVFYHKVKELKMVLAGNYEELLKNVVIEEETKVTAPEKRVEFQLLEFNGLWLPLIPSLPSDISPFSILNQNMIDYIVEQARNDLGAVNKPVLFEGISKSVYLLTFSVADDNLIEGKLAVDNSDTYKDNVEVVECRFRKSQSTGTTMENLKILLQYLTSNPELRHHFIAEFQLKWKPIIDAELLNAK